MIKLEPGTITEEGKLALEDFLSNILDPAFSRKDYDYNRFKLNCALKQKTMRKASIDGDLRTFGIDPEYVKKADNVDLSENYRPDEFSGLFNPILMAIFRALLTHVGNICFPLNGETSGIKRNYSEFFDNNNINDFLPQMDACWQSILSVQNRNNQSKAVYESVLSEGLAHGVWALDHEYDPQSGVVEPVAPGVDNVGLYPLRADWRKSNRCFYVDVNLSQLVGREDLDQEVLDRIRPQVNYDSNETERTGGTAHKNTSSIPFGQVRLIKWYCPSVYHEYENETYVGENLYIVALINPDFKPSEKNIENRKLYILKFDAGVPMDRHGLLLGTPVINQPKEFFNEGIFYPWLSHQLTANEMYSDSTRLASYLSKGPLNAEKTGFGAIDTDEEDLTKGFLPFQVLKNRKYSPVFAPELAEFIKVAYMAMSQIESSIEKGIGIDKNTMAAVNNGQNGKDELLKAGNAGFLKCLEYAVRFNDQIYIPSQFTIIKCTQDILMQEVEGKLQEIKQFLSAETEMAQFIPPDEAIVEEILGENKLFKRLVNSCGLRQKYREFYKKRQKEILKNESIVIELQIAEQDIMGMMQFAASPVIKEAMGPFPTQQLKNEETGKLETVEMTAEMKQKYIQEWEQDQQEQRRSAEREARIKTVEIKEKQLSLMPIEDIPPLSNLLLFNMLTEAIEESDIKVGGVISAILNSLTADEVAEIIRLVGVMPEEEQKKIDFGDLFTIATKGKTITKDLIMKSEEEQVRQEESDNRRAEFDRQMTIEMSKVPGAQPPQIGRGNRSG